MRESMWGTFILMFGILCILLIFFFQNLTNTDEHNYTILKETTEAAMIDAVDLGTYRKDGVIRIDREKFVENFLRRFAESASLSSAYVVSFYDINETPPKVSVKISSKAGGVVSFGFG
ncbi:MAG: hypothetical protein IJZ36_01005, partial [Bacilli bacterium]|nr:hypothetical protein [Bacilli bacterium]